MERIGGTVSFILNEIAGKLTKLRPIQPKQKDSTVLAKASTYLFMFSVMPFMVEFVKLLEKIYINNRTMQDMLEDIQNSELKK